MVDLNTVWFYNGILMVAICLFVGFLFAELRHHIDKKFKKLVRFSYAPNMIDDDVLKKFADRIKKITIRDAEQPHEPGQESGA